MKPAYCGLIILWLASLSAGTAAFLGGRAAWMLRYKGRRTEYGVAWALALWAYALAKLATTCTSIALGPRNQSIAFFVSQTVWSNLEGAGVWIIALTLMNGQQGWIRRHLTIMLEKLEGKETKMSEHDKEHPEHPETPPTQTPTSPPDTPGQPTQDPTDPGNVPVPPVDPPGGGG